MNTPPTSRKFRCLALTIAALFCLLFGNFLSADLIGYQFISEVGNESYRWEYLLDNETLYGQVSITDSNGISTTTMASWATVSYNSLPPDSGTGLRSYQDGYEIHFRFYITGFGGGLGDLAHSMGVMLEDDAFEGLDSPYAPFVPQNVDHGAANIHYWSGTGLYLAEFSAWVVPEPSTISLIIMAVAFLLPAHRCGIHIKR